MDIRTRFRHPELIFLEPEELDESMLEEWEGSKRGEPESAEEDDIALELLVEGGLVKGRPQGELSRASANGRKTGRVPHPCL